MNRSVERVDLERRGSREGGRAVEAAHNPDQSPKRVCACVRAPSRPCEGAGWGGRVVHFAVEYIACLLQGYGCSDFYFNRQLDCSTCEQQTTVYFRLLVIVRRPANQLSIAKLTIIRGSHRQRFKINNTVVMLVKY